MSLSCSGIPRRLSQQWYLSHPVPLGSSGLGPFLSLSLFLKTLTVMRSTAQGFCRPSLNEYLSNIFLLMSNKEKRSYYWSWEEWITDHRGKVPSSSHPIKGTYNQHSYCCWCDSDLLAEQRSNRFPHHKTALFFLAFHTVLFGEKSLCIASTPECRVLLHFFEDEECK